jgi:hypothetical protein
MTAEQLNGSTAQRLDFLGQHGWQTMTTIMINVVLLIISVFSIIIGCRFQLPDLPMQGGPWLSLSVNESLQERRRISKRISRRGRRRPKWMVERSLEKQALH